MLGHFLCEMRSTDEPLLLYDRPRKKCERENIKIRVWEQQQQRKQQQQRDKQAE